MNKQNGNGQIQQSALPTDDAVGRKVGEPDFVFKNPKLDNVERLELKPRFEKIFYEFRNPMAVPLDLLRKFAAADGSEKDIESLAKARFDSDPTRAAVIGRCKALLAATKERVRSDFTYRDRWSQTKDHAPLFERKASNDAAAIFRQANVPALVKICLLVLIFCFGLAAEFSNITFLVLNSGLGFEGDFFGAVCFGGVYCIAPFVIGEFLKFGHSIKDRCRWALMVKIVSLPLVVVGLAMFAFKMDGLDNFDVFAEATGTWDLPFWLTLLGTMLLLAITVMVIPSLLDASVSQLWPYSLIESREITMAKREAKAISDCLAEAVGYRTRTLHLLETIRVERDEFVLLCLLVFRSMKVQLKARQDSIRAEETAAVEAAQLDLRRAIFSAKKAEEERAESAKQTAALKEREARVKATRLLATEAISAEEILDEFNSSAFENNSI